MKGCSECSEGVLEGVLEVLGVVLEVLGVVLEVLEVVLEVLDLSWTSWKEHVLKNLLQLLLLQLFLLLTWSEKSSPMDFLGVPLFPARNNRGETFINQVERASVRDETKT